MEGAHAAKTTTYDIAMSLLSKSQYEKCLNCLDFKTINIRHVLALKKEDKLSYIQSLFDSYEVSPQLKLMCLTLVELCPSRIGTYKIIEMFLNYDKWLYKTDIVSQCRQNLLEYQLSNPNKYKFTEDLAKLSCHQILEEAKNLIKNEIYDANDVWHERMMREIRGNWLAKNTLLKNELKDTKKCLKETLIMTYKDVRIRTFMNRMAEKLIKVKRKCKILCSLLFKWKRSKFEKSLIAQIKKGINKSIKYARNKNEMSEIKKHLIEEEENGINDTIAVFQIAQSIINENQNWKKLFNKLSLDTQYKAMEIITDNTDLKQSNLKLKIKENIESNLNKFKLLLSNDSTKSRSLNQIAEQDNEWEDMEEEDEKDEVPTKSKYIKPKHALMKALKIKDT